MSLTSLRALLRTLLTVLVILTNSLRVSHSQIENVLMKLGIFNRFSTQFYAW